VPLTDEGGYVGGRSWLDDHGDACAVATAVQPAGGCIGIDDGLSCGNPSAVTDARARAERFADLFRAIYLTFHRRDGPRSQLPGASRAVLEHLALA
jgi:hypothetical protein